MPFRDFGWLPQRHRIGRPIGRRVLKHNYLHSGGVQTVQVGHPVNPSFGELNGRIPAIKLTKNVVVIYAFTVRAKFAGR